MRGECDARHDARFVGHDEYREGGKVGDTLVEVIHRQVNTISAGLSSRRDLLNTANLRFTETSPEQSHRSPHTGDDSEG